MINSFISLNKVKLLIRYSVMGIFCRFDSVVPARIRSTGRMTLLKQIFQFNKIFLANSFNDLLQFFFTIQRLPVTIIFI